MVVPAFGSTILKGLMDETIITGHWLHVMTQAPYPEDEANLPIGLYVLCNYCEMKDSSRLVYLVLSNGTSRPICDAMETGGMSPVTTTNDTMTPPRRRQGALVRINETFLLLIRLWQCIGLETALSKIQCIK